ncbi:MAG: aminopeptidase P family protein [Clostridiales Family XIII bacterium]|jgi:Xaa-Pro aminopeptidase|nr:aminopeptidase P family protein [Clostridiales Family XIII bacterium]
MIIKTDEEIQIMKLAAELGSVCFEAAQAFLSTNLRTDIKITERLLAEFMEGVAESFEEDYEGLSFPPIIASGPNSAFPHAELTDRVIQTGEFLTIDFGVMAHGFASDMTRTVFVGSGRGSDVSELSAKQKLVYDTVLKAQLAGIASARPGVACKDLDKIVRDIIEEAGFGEHFLHTTGHGVGEEVHEAPRIGKEDETVLEENMVVTIEPGIYIEGFGGVRIEDTVVITKEGCEIITIGGMPKELTII